MAQTLSSRGSGGGGTGLTSRAPSCLEQPSAQDALLNPSRPLTTADARGYSFAEQAAGVDQGEVFGDSRQLLSSRLLQPSSQQLQRGSSPGNKPSSRLNVSAAEFRPAAPASATPVTTAIASMRLHNGGSSSRQDGWKEEPGGSSDADRWDGSGSSWQHDGSNSSNLAGDGGYEHVHPHHHGDSSIGPVAGTAAALAADDAAGASEFVAGGLTAQGAFLAVLAEQFPLFSDQALHQLFVEQGCSLAATIQMLCSLESEVQGQQAAGTLGATGVAGAWEPEGTPSAQEASGHAAPAFTEEDFPSLGGSAANTQSRSSSGHDGGGSAVGGQAVAYASKARAAANLPSQLPARKATSHGTQRSASGAPASVVPAPIWEQAEGVQQFATGAALAAEYAQLRADARDHARLRNAYFQQATQAYLAGDRRLARELGAQGRWHGEQMHASHQAAASELFARRNPVSGAVVSRGDGVPTLDLHGLHVSEALQQLESLVPSLQTGAKSKQLRLVVGRGTHGKVPARLPAAVRRWLQDHGLQFSEPYAGLLEVRL